MKVCLQHDDAIHDECGVFGIFGHDEAVTYSILGLHALQHRGQEAAGLAASDGGMIHLHRAPGLVGEAFGKNGVFDPRGLSGRSAIGHVRYSTAGDARPQNIQPLYTSTDLGPVALAHNGNLTNYRALCHKLQTQGIKLESSSDSEIFLQLIKMSAAPNWQKRIEEALKQVVGAYSVVMLTDNQVFGFRDPHGVRPLVIGEIDGCYVLASETCALEMIGATYVRDVKPGELISLDKTGLTSTMLEVKEPRFCIFEYVYFMRPNSHFEGKYVSEVRETIGAKLYEQAPVEADVVVPVPDSGVHAAIGFAHRSGVAYQQGIIRSHYVGRTFIEPAQEIRNLGVKLKLSVNTAAVKGKRVVLVDDSIVRGTTMGKIVNLVRAAGAKEVHVRVASPPFAHPCFYGIDTPCYDELVAAHKSMAEIEKMVGADSLSYLSLDALYQAVGFKGRTADRQMCDACFSGDYDIELIDERQQLKEAS